MDVSEKQALAFELFADPQIVDFDFGGGAGGGKTITVTEWAVLQCRQYPGIRIGIGRNEISNLRRTTIQTLLYETHPLLHVRESDYKYHDLINPRVDYRNGSQILFVDLAYAPRDPNYDRLGSLNLTHTIIEEQGEVRRQAKEVFSSRKNRYLNKKYNIVGKHIGTQNPATNWTRGEYYDPYAKLVAINGNEDYQKWPIVNDEGEAVHVYMPDGRRLPAYRAFIKSLATDNPFLSQNYIEELKSKPLAERKRLLKGDWNYYHDASTMFKRHMFERAPSLQEAVNYGSCDPSLGGDKCIFTWLQGIDWTETVEGKTIEHSRRHVKEIVELKIPEGTKNPGDFVGAEFIKFCRQRKIGYQNAALDVVGIGQASLEACQRVGFMVQPFRAGTTTGVRTLDDKRIEQRVDEDNKKGVRLFDNIRSQNYYDMAAATTDGTLTFDDKLDEESYDGLCTELEAHGYSVNGNMIIVDKKNDGANSITSKIGQSPDYADSLQGAWWVSKRRHYSIKQLVSI